MRTFRVTWAKQGDHREDPPLVLQADDFSISDGAYVFWEWASPTVRADRRVAAVRQSDVSLIEQVTDSGS